MSRITSQTPRSHRLHTMTGRAPPAVRCPRTEDKTSCRRRRRAWLVGDFRQGDYSYDWANHIEPWWVCDDQFRHIHSSLLNDLRVPVTIAQEQLGHTSVTTTLNVFTHVVDASYR